MTRFFIPVALLRATLLSTFAAVALAGDDPIVAPVPEVQPVATPGPPADAEAPADETASAPVPETPPAAGAAVTTVVEPTAADTQRIARVVLLPVEFSVFQRGVSGMEVIPDWTEKARTNIAAAASTVLMERANLELVAMPELSPEETQQLREHLALVRTFMAQIDQLDAAKEAAWQGRKPGLDRRIGHGLDFLREKTGADFAVYIDGAQAKQSGGSVFSQIALAAVGVISIGGGGTYIRASVLDLEAGLLRWFNERSGRESYGISGSDVRKAAETQAVLRRLFEPYPSVPRLVPRW